MYVKRKTVILLIILPFLLCSCQSNSTNTAQTNPTPADDNISEVQTTSSQEKMQNLEPETVTNSRASSFSVEFKSIEYLPTDNKFLLESIDDIKYVLEKNGNIKLLSDSTIITPKLSIIKGKDTILNNKVVDIYGNNITHKFITNENQAAIGVEEYENDQVVWVLEREERLSDSYVKYIGYTSDGNELISFDSNQYPTILFDRLFNDLFLSGYPVYKGNGIFALRKPYGTAAEVGGGNYITTDGEDLTEYSNYLNINTKEVFSVEGSKTGVYNNMFGNSSFYYNKLYDLNGNVIREYETTMRYLGEGKAINNNDSWFETEIRYIYDLVTGKKIIDFTEYQDTLQWVDKFADGYILVVFENEQDHEYAGVMNDQGEWVIEPYKTEVNSNGETYGFVCENKVLLKGVVYDLINATMMPDPIQNTTGTPIRLNNKAYYLSNGIPYVYDYDLNQNQKINLNIN